MLQISRKQEKCHTDTAALRDTPPSETQRRDWKMCLNRDISGTREVSALRQVLP